MEPFLGQIQAFGFNFAPRGWAQCDGQILPINQNQSLYSLLGTTYGGDGRTSFALPDLRGRSIVHPGSGSGLATIQQGQRSGAEQLQLTVSNLPSHNHIATTKIAVNGDDAEDVTPVGNFLAKSTNATDSYIDAAGTNQFLADTGAVTTVANTGGSQSISSRNPYVGVNICIALQGLFPSRS